MFSIAAVSPLAYIAPVYARPPLIDVETTPSDLKHLDVDFGGELKLIGYRVEAQSGTDGVARFTLYWQCLKQPDVDYSVFVIAYGRNLQEIGKRDAYPQRGLFGTRQCETGKVIVDAYRLRLKVDAQRPTVIHLQVGLKDWQTRSELKPASNGQPLGSVMFDGGQLSPAAADRSPEVAAHYRLSDAIELMGYDAPTFDPVTQQVHYRLYWRALKDGGESYTVFAHLLDGGGQSIGQGDSPPFDGDYPTSVWQAGETLIEERWVKADTTHLLGAQLTLGLYQLADGARLPVSDAAGQRLPDDQIVIPVKN